MEIKIGFYAVKKPDDNIAEVLRIYPDHYLGNNMKACGRIITVYNGWELVLWDKNGHCTHSSYGRKMEWDLSELIDDKFTKLGFYKTEYDSLAEILTTRFEIGEIWGIYKFKDRWICAAWMWNGRQYDDARVGSLVEYIGKEVPDGY